MGIKPPYVNIRAVEGVELYKEVRTATMKFCSPANRPASSLHMRKISKATPPPLPSRLGAKQRGNCVGEVGESV